MESVKIPVVQRSARHWYTDGSVIVQAGETLYNIHRSMMIQKSAVFADMFALPMENLNTTDIQGIHEENPIVLHNVVTSIMLDDLLDWIYKIDWHPMAKPSYPERFLVNILMLSTMWDIPSGRQFAIACLDILNLHPARQIELSRMFGIDEWVSTAFEDLIKLDLTTLSEDQERMIGFKTYIILAKAKEFVEHERKLIASIPPPMAFVQSFECEHHDDCRTAWKELWWKKVARSLLHPRAPMVLETGVTYVEQLEFEGMSACCKADMVEVIKQRNAFGIVEKVVEEAGTAVLAYNKSLC
ncbi:hypothetical protein BJ138DRAFT_1189012 [Hygrophoropsis aurantiaca]|uniref:Uncharacterized protein n=1 Tax=Hygrophoropsis aurantiaca TaxID=72124 RepID=A0ACB7ZRW9_9AGAM|nr:hypothetical protein BJ138DRAFT_1189012 [Hygrophoropsis aurantiaca]